MYKSKCATQISIHCVRAVTPILGCLFVLCLIESANAGMISVTATIRDFKDSHPDFEGAILGLETGVVSSILGGDGKPVFVSGSGQFAGGAAGFDEWYNDVPGVNLKTSLTLDAIETLPGIYTYSNSAFFPVDGMLFGNQGRSHNFHFTTEIHTEFTYTGGESFSFTGDDDVWVFINGKLAIDIGGVHGSITKSVDLDAAAIALGISTGGKYDLDIFHAERHTSESNFKFTTSLVLADAPTIPEPSSLALLGMGIIGLGGAHWRRKRKTELNA